MGDYRDAYRHFSVQQLAREVLHGSLADGVNAAVECCDRWAEGGRVALNWISKDFAGESVTFEVLRQQSARFANLLRARGIGKGDVVGGLLPRLPELLVVALGTWRIGAIYQPLFTAFGPAAIASRVTAPGGSHAKLIVTDAANRTKLDGLENCPPLLLEPRPQQINLSGAAHTVRPLNYDQSPGKLGQTHIGQNHRVRFSHGATLNRLAWVSLALTSWRI